MILTKHLQRAIFRTCAALATTTIRPTRALQVGLVGTASTTTTRLFATNSDEFVPAAPPGTHGIPVFPNVDFSVISDDARQRKEDPNAVFVVTGASRGIGLQFVKTLSQETKASTDTPRMLKNILNVSFSSQQSIFVTGKNHSVLSQAK